LKEAYQGYAVEFAENPREPRLIHVKDLLGLGDGETYPILKESTVNFWHVLSTLKGVVGCHTVPFSECPQKAGIPREELVRALGRGIGATGAHELGHQAGFHFTNDVTGCPDCYDSDSATSHVHFFGTLQWSGAARERMRRLLPSATSR